MGPTKQQLPRGRYHHQPPRKGVVAGRRGHPAVTKADLATYYKLAAPRILPFTAGRPLSLVRAPEGIDGQRFFQRHAMEGMQATGKINVAGEKKPFLEVHTEKGLVELAQAASLELHPWGCKKADPETPAMLIFDLDPAPDVQFDQTIEAAKAMRAKLIACGLTPFVKTTGGKGLHVAAAIKRSSRTSPTWPDAKSFARDICAALERDDPAHYTTNMSKKKRDGKIFLDYLRNDRMATAVAPWSPRARPHATIAVPLSWGQLKRGLDPQSFTLADGKRLLGRTDPWKDFEKSAGALDAAHSKLKG